MGTGGQDRVVEVTMTFPTLRPRRLAALLSIGLFVAGIPFVTRQAGAVRASIVVLDARLAGGFAPASSSFGAVPLHLVTDTQHFSTIGVASEFGRSMLQPVTVSPIRATTLRRIDKLAKAAGLTGATIDWGIPPTADVPELQVQYRGRRHSIASWGVGEELLNPTQRAARRKVAELLAALPNDGTVFKPSRVVLAVQLADPSAVANGAPAPQLKDWPADAEDISSSGGCMIITTKSGIAALTSANAFTQFRKSAKTWQVFGRPMLPGDKGCGPSA
jgi:hypothetical protein